MHTTEISTSSISCSNTNISDISCIDIVIFSICIERILFGLIKYFGIEVEINNITDNNHLIIHLFDLPLVNNNAP